MHIENRYVKDRRVHVDRRLGTTPEGYVEPERRTKNNRRGYLDRRLNPWSWHSGHKQELEEMPVFRSMLFKHG